MDQPIDSISGGELQRVAIAACLARDADFYFLDEITPYLDIGQRMIVARLIRELADDDAAERSMLVVEHDLAILDLLADTLHVAYGEPGAYGVVTDPKSVRNGINEYLKGYLDNENMRIRPSAITFEEHAPRVSSRSETLIEYPELEVVRRRRVRTPRRGRRDQPLRGARRRRPERDREVDACEAVRGLVGTGRGELDFALDIAYKPQYIDIDQPMRVDVFLSSITDDFGSSYWNTEIAQPLQLDRVMEQNLSDLSGGERQRVAIAACLSEDADLYLLDEPSAHLDVEQRVRATTAIRRYAENHDATVMVIDHDIYMIDLLADRLMVFDGEPAERGARHAAAGDARRDERVPRGPGHHLPTRRADGPSPDQQAGLAARQLTEARRRVLLLGVVVRSNSSDYTTCEAKAAALAVEGGQGRPSASQFIISR